MHHTFALFTHAPDQAVQRPRLLHCAFNLAPVALRVTDVLMVPTWIIGGALLRRRKAIGLVSGPSLLFQVSMLFIGLIALVALRPFVSDQQFPVTDAFAVLAVGLICFIPFALFLRGAAWKIR